MNIEEGMSVINIYNNVKYIVVNVENGLIKVRDKDNNFFIMTSQDIKKVER